MNLFRRIGAVRDFEYRDHIGIDTRALATFRIFLGFLLLIDLALRARHLTTFYTDAGVFPRSTLHAEYPLLSKLSIHALSGAAWFQATLFVVAAVFAIALLAGYHTRIATVASLVLLVSLQARNPLVLNGGDSLLRRLLFWSVFLPLGARWSIDADRHRPVRDRIANLASAALLLQVVAVYTVTSLFKHERGLWSTGQAVRDVFSLREFTVLLGPMFAHQTTLLTAVDWIWLVMVTASVLLIVFTGWTRAAFAACFMAAHLTMSLTLRLGIFPLVSVTALVPFLPPVVWDTAGRWTPRFERLRSPVVSRLVDRLPRSRPLSSEIPAVVGRTVRRTTRVLIVLILVGLLTWNAASLGYIHPLGRTTSHGSITPSEYSWNMFANPPQFDFWYVAPARLESGKQVDAFTGGSVSWTPPTDFAERYPSARWRKYLENVRRRSDPKLNRPLAGYLCRRWRRTHRSRLTEIRLVVVEQPTGFSGSKSATRTTVWNGTCPALSGAS